MISTFKITDYVIEKATQDVSNWIVFQKAIKVELPSPLK